MNTTRTARDYIDALCYGTLYERLAAAADVAEAAVRAGTEWNDFVVILHALGNEHAQAVEIPHIEVRALQKRILSAYAGHPLLRTDEPLEMLVSHFRSCDPDVIPLVATSSTEKARREAAYIDRVRQSLGQLTAPPLVLPHL